MKVSFSIRPYSSRLFAAVVLLSVSSYAYAGMIDKEGMQAWEICGMCHSADGISRMAKFPKLAGQKADYIERQVNNFRAGVRHNDGGQMQSIVGEVAAQDVAKIAAYFSSLPPDSEFEFGDSERTEKRRSALSLGESLFKVGRDGVSACANCHTSVSSNAPWLDGQHQQYLEKQMQDFIAGDRDSACLVPKQNSEKNVLESDSNWLEDSEIEALALYLSTLLLKRN